MLGGVSVGMLVHLAERAGFAGGVFAWGRGWININLSCRADQTCEV